MSKLSVIKPYTSYISILPGNKGLSIEEDTPFEAFEEAVHAFGSIVADGLWALGDLFVFGERVYGEKWAQAIDGMKYSEKTIANATWVCKTFPPSRRHKSLTFNHHAAVAGVEDVKVREEILHKAEKEELTVKQITEEKKKRFPKKARTTKAKDAPESHEDEAGESEITEEATDSEPAIPTHEEAATALKTLNAYFEFVGKDMLPEHKEALSEDMTLLRRLARRSGYWGGN